METKNKISLITLKLPKGTKLEDFIKWDKQLTYDEVRELYNQSSNQ